MHSIEKIDESTVNITLTRGDSLFLQVDLVKNDEPYVPGPEAFLRFAMKQRYKDPDEEVLVVKTIPISTMILEIAPEDTKTLVMGKTYVYDIELTDEQGHVDTFIKGTFTIGEEVI